MSFFFFNDTATTEIYTLSLHDALPICRPALWPSQQAFRDPWRAAAGARHAWADRKSTRLNSSHSQISYAVFCLKKKKKLVYEIAIVIDIHPIVCVHAANTRRPYYGSFI